MSPEIECQVCHRLEFGDSPICQECRWPIREIQLDAPVFGFDVAIEIRLPGLCNTKIIEKHFAAKTAAAAMSQAKRTRDFIRVLALRPLDEKHYIAAYGVPGQRM